MSNHHFMNSLRRERTPPRSTQKSGSKQLPHFPMTPNSRASLVNSANNTKRKSTLAAAINLAANSQSQKAPQKSFARTSIPISRHRPSASSSSLLPTNLYANASAAASALLSPFEGNNYKRLFDFSAALQQPQQTEEEEESSISPVDEDNHFLLRKALKTSRVKLATELNESLPNIPHAQALPQQHPPSSKSSVQNVFRSEGKQRSLAQSSTFFKTDNNHQLHLLLLQGTKPSQTPTHRPSLSSHDFFFKTINDDIQREKAAPQRDMVPEIATLHPKLNKDSRKPANAQPHPAQPSWRDKRFQLKQQKGESETQAEESVLQQNIEILDQIKDINEKMKGLPKKLQPKPNTRCNSAIDFFMAANSNSISSTSNDDLNKTLQDSVPPPPPLQSILLVDRPTRTHGRSSRNNLFSSTPCIEMTLHRDSQGVTQTPLSPAQSHTPVSWDQQPNVDEGAFESSYHADDLECLERVVNTSYLGEDDDNEEEEDKKEEGENNSDKQQSSSADSILDRAFIGDDQGLGTATTAHTSQPSTKLSRTDRLDSKTFETTRGDANSSDPSSFLPPSSSIASFYEPLPRETFATGFSDISPIQSQPIGQKKKTKKAQQGSHSQHDLFSSSSSHSSNSQDIKPVSLSQRLFTRAASSCSMSDLQGLLDTSVHHNAFAVAPVAANIPIIEPKEQSSVRQETSLKDEITNPLIKTKLKQFLQEIGYYNNKHLSEQVNDIMAEAALGLVIEKAKSSPSKYQQEEEQPLHTPSSQQAQQEDEIESRHFESLKREVQILHQLCGGQNNAEKEISKKIVNEVLCAQFGKRNIQDAMKNAVKRSRTLRTMKPTKSGSLAPDQLIQGISTEQIDSVILEREEETEAKQQIPQTQTRAVPTQPQMSAAELKSKKSQPKYAPRKRNMPLRSATTSEASGNDLDVASQGSPLNGEPAGDKLPLRKNATKDKRLKK